LDSNHFQSVGFWHWVSHITTKLPSRPWQSVSQLFTLRAQQKEGFQYHQGMGFQIYPRAKLVNLPFLFFKRRFVQKCGFMAMLMGKLMINLIKHHISGYPSFRQTQVWYDLTICWCVSPLIKGLPKAKGYHPAVQ
jgi:hypothetical protein